MSLYRRPNSPFWWSKLYVAGAVVRFSTGERTKVAALRAERARVEDLERVAKLEGRYPLNTLAAKFLLWKESDGRAPSWVAKMTQHIEVHILPHFGAERDVRTIDERALEEYKSKRALEVQPVTVCKELATLRQMLKYAVEVHKVMDRVPRVRNPRFRYEPKWRLLTRDELGRLLNAVATLKNKEVLPYFLLMANTGMRGGEVFQLTWEMVDRGARTLRLPAAITKTRRSRVIDLNDGAEAALNMLHAPGKVGRMFHQRNHYNAWHRACAAAGLGKVRPHDLRHTLGSLMHAAGAPTPVVRDTLGHVTLAMANLYAHSYDEGRKRAVASVSIMPTASVPSSVPLPPENVPVHDLDAQNGAANKTEEITDASTS